MTETAGARGSCAVDGNVLGYAGRGEDYRARPAYPPQLISELVAACGLSGGDKVVEIGAGTGALSRILLGGELEVFAVEPSDLLATAVADLGDHPRFHAIHGDALRPNIPASLCGQIKAVVVGQALHWWEDSWREAILSWQSFLATDGHLLDVLYYLRDDDPLASDLDATLSQHQDGYDQRTAKIMQGNSPGFHDERHERYFVAGRAASKTVSIRQYLTRLQFRTMMGSFSFMPHREREQREFDRIMGQLLPVFERHARAEAGFEEPVVALTREVKGWFGPLRTDGLTRKEQE